TRRRVNALEHVLIPQLQAAVREITMRLSEMERSNISRLMKIKEIVRAR
ncbi:MAG TPA: V-type ATP synthase subunit D, partial [Bacillota bacterium]|nr:V-type ATP synthase subunit D [Bacillota bacterium]